MATYSEGNYLGDWLKAEAENAFSREQVVILAGSGAARELTTGMVLSKVTKGVAASTVVSGADTITIAPTVGAAAKVGTYHLTCIVAGATGKFLVEDPDGVTIGIATVGTEFTTHLTFTIADAGAHAVVGDVITIAVAAGSGKWVQYSEDGGATGIDVPSGVLLLDVTAPSGADAKGVVIVRDAIINSDQIVWPSTTDATEKSAALAVLKSLGIIAREGV